MITKEEYVKKIEYEKDRVTKSIIDSVRKSIDTCAQGMPIVKDYSMSEYELEYFDKKKFEEFEKEYPFLLFVVYGYNISWILREEEQK
jgi:hypothetical protein